MRGIARIQPGWGITAVRVGMAAIFIVAGYHKFAVGLGGPNQLRLNRLA